MGPDKSGEVGKTPRCAHQHLGEQSQIQTIKKSSCGVW